jgi:hypothetical protein
MVVHVNSFDEGKEVCGTQILPLTTMRSHMLECSPCRRMFPPRILAGSVRISSGCRLSKGEYTAECELYAHELGWELRMLIDGERRPYRTNRQASIRLLADDTACVWRHRFDPSTGDVKAFRSGYSNAPCPPDR